MLRKELKYFILARYGGTYLARIPLTPATQVAEAGGLQIPGQPGLQRETLPQIN
jgi:hypothetical protein